MHNLWIRTSPRELMSYWQDKATIRSNTKCYLRSSEERYFYWTSLHSSIYACKTFRFSWLKTDSNSNTGEWIIYQDMIQPFFWNLTRPKNLTFTLEETQEKKRNDGGTPVPRTTCICGSWSFGATIVDEDAAWLLSWAICAISDQSRTDTSKRERDASKASHDGVLPTKYLPALPTTASWHQDDRFVPGQVYSVATYSLIDILIDPRKGHSESLQLLFQSNTHKTQMPSWDSLVLLGPPSTSQCHAYYYGQWPLVAIQIFAINSIPSTLTAPTAGAILGWMTNISRAWNHRFVALIPAGTRSSR